MFHLLWWCAAYSPGEGLVGAGGHGTPRIPPVALVSILEAAGIAAGGARARGRARGVAQPPAVPLVVVEAGPGGLWLTHSIF